MTAVKSVNIAGAEFSESCVVHFLKFVVCLEHV